MAFGKKQQEETPLQNVAADTDDVAGSGSDLSGDLFATGTPAEDAGSDDPLSQPEAGADPGMPGDLLNMFQTTQIEEQDRSVLKTLAGDVELGDLVEELHTLAAAFGIKIDREALVS